MTVKLTRLDLDFILTQIQMAEAGQPPVNASLSFGLREIAGTNNNLTHWRQHLRLVAAAFPDGDRSDVPERPGRHLLFADQRAGRRRAAAHDQPDLIANSGVKSGAGRHSRHRG